MLARTKLYAAPRLTICLPSSIVDGEKKRGDEIAHVDGLRPGDHDFFRDELSIALCEEVGVPYRMAHELFEVHVDGAAGYAKPIGLGPGGVAELRAFARALAFTIADQFLDATAKERAA